MVLKLLGSIQIEQLGHLVFVLLFIVTNDFPALFLFIEKDGCPSVALVIGDGFDQRICVVVDRATSFSQSSSALSPSSSSTAPPSATQ